MLWAVFSSSTEFLIPSTQIKSLLDNQMDRWINIHKYVQIHESREEGRKEEGREKEEKNEKRRRDEGRQRGGREKEEAGKMHGKYSEESLIRKQEYLSVSAMQC